MRRLSVSLLFLLAGTFTFAQTSSNSPTVLKNSPTSTLTNEQKLAIISRLANSNFGCPVGFFASRQATGQIMSVSDAKQTGPAQGLHLILNHLGSTPDIQSIEVTVYGTSLNERVLPVDTQATGTAAKTVDPRSSDTVTRTFNLQRRTGSDSLSDADVWMHQVGSLSWADLISITYVDGTTWHATENLKCRAIPSNLLLVGSR